MAVMSRRQSLALLSSLSLFSMANFSLAQASDDRKFIFVFLRGAMDGLSALIPDDSELENLRGTILPEKSSRLDLQNGFRLHPSFAGINKLYAKGDAAFVHASATSYRNRSHFEAQDFLEILGRPGAKDGWLNRVLHTDDRQGIAVGRAVPLAMKGAAPALNWSPPLFDTISDDLIGRLSSLYEDDSTFSTPLETAVSGRSELSMETSRRNARRFTREYTATLSAIGSLMSAENSPSIGMVSLGGWDTHANQKTDLKRKFKALDNGLIELKKSLGSHWKKTCIVVCSEFGRTVSANGSKGTDHGTGGLTMILGGAVNGGAVHGEWPGIKTANLHEGRDLFPANDISAILKGIMLDHLDISRKDLETNIFPNSGKAFSGLIQT